MDGITAYALSKKVAASAVSGVKSMSVDGQTLTINTKDSGVLKMVFPTPSNGVSVTDIDVNANNQIVFTMSDGTEITSGVIPTVKGADGKSGKDGKAFTYDDFTEEQLEALKVKGDKGDPGKDAVSPTITENENNTDKIYKLDVTTADGTFTTPNLKGKDGSGSSTGEENVIESIKVNGVAQTVAKDKSVDITVPSIEGLAKSEDLATVATSGSYNDLTDTPSIPNEYDDTALKNRVVTIETNIGDMSTIKIKSVSDLVSAINALHDSFMSGISYADKKLTITYRNGGKVEVDLSPIITDTEISELENVDDTGVVDKQVLAYDATSSKYKPISIDLASVLQDSKAYTDIQISKINSMDAYAVDEKPAYSGGIITYKKNGETLTTENSDIWFYYTVNDMNYQTLFIDGVEFTISVDGDINFKDFVSKSNDLTSTYTGEEVDKTKVTTIGALDALYTIISTAIGKKVNTVDIVDNLESDSIDKPLSAHQGKVLDSKIFENTNSIKELNSDKVDKIEGKGLSSNDYTSEEKNKLGGVGTSQGRNLIPYPLTNRITNGITYTVQSDGSVLANGTASAENNAYYNFAYKTLKLGDTSYTLSCEGLPKSVYVYVYDETISKAVANVSDTPATKTFVGDSTHTYSLSINVGKGTSVSDLAIKPILEMGTIAHAYEPISESNVNLKDAIDKVSTSQGRNLISYPYYNGTSFESNGVTYTVNEVDGTITVNGTATKESDFRLVSPYDTSDRKTLELGQTYTLSDGVNQPNTSGYQAPVYFQFVRIDTTKNDFNYGISTNYGNMTWTASDANLLQYGIRIVVRSGVTVDNVVLKPMLEIGAIAHMYEPTTESNVNLKETIKGLVTPQGKNLISYPYTTKEGTGNGITWTVNDDGTIAADGTATNNSFFNLTNYIVGKWGTLHAGTYTIMDGVNLPIGGVTLQVESITGTQYKNKTFTIEQDVAYKIFIYIPKGTVANNITFKPMLEVGSIAHMYEPTTESNISLKKSIETKATINDTSTTSTTETWSAKKINEKTARNFDNRIILSVGRGTSGEYTDTANLNNADGAYLYWSSTAGQEKYSVGVILYVNNDWMIIPIKETDGGTNIKFSINKSILTMTKSSSTFPSAGGVIALGTSI